MISDKFKTKYDQLVAKELAHKASNIILSVAVAIMSFTAYNLYTNERIVVVPTNVSKEFWISSNKLSESYLNQMGQYVSTALMNVSPNSAKQQFELVLELAAPEFYQTLKMELNNQNKYLVENGITSAFYPKSYKFEKDKIVINGQKNNIIGDKVVERRDIVLTVNYIVQNGRFYISKFEIK